MKIKERTKKFIEENKTVLIGCGLGIVGSIAIFIAGKKIGEIDLTRRLSEKWEVNLFKPNIFAKIKDDMTFKDLFPNDEFPDIAKSIGMTSTDELRGILLMQKK